MPVPSALLDDVEVVGLGPALPILQAVARMPRESVEGQPAELEWIRDNRWALGDGDYVAMVVQKTGWYSFIVPMQVGAIAAGASREQVNELVDSGATSAWPSRSCRERTRDVSSRR